MRMRLLIMMFLLLPAFSFGQDPDADYGWWNELHDWKPGDPGWRNWMKISPGYLGPNALPVPPVKKGLITGSPEISITTSGHFLKGDPTQDISLKTFIPFANNKIAVEIYGVAIEHFAFSEEIRNERISRDKDGKGMAVGDLYFCTHIQILKERRFPNTLFRFGAKTASGSQLAAARYTDSPGYFFDLSFSKSWGKNAGGIFRPFWGLGFYSWQTNDELRLQNDALMYQLGTDFSKREWSFSAALSGYSGYKNERDRPVQLNFDIRKDYAKKAIKVQYINGLRTWQHNTARITFIWKFNISE